MILQRAPAAAPLVLALAALAATASVPGAGSAQELPPPGTPPQEIQRQIDAAGLRSSVLRRMQASGLTPDQIRQRLASMGYDPSVLDPYLTDQADLAAATEPSGSALSAAEALGLLSPESMPRDSLALVVREAPDSSALERERELRVFGLDVFSRATSEFQAVTTGPVPPGYTVGPGDELVLILTGDVERFYDLPVTREGFVVIPQVGQVWVNGLTLAEIRDQLYARLGESYSGIGRGPEATTHFQLTLGQLRPNQVFVTGQVARPGTYVVSAVASALNALYMGGGPLPTGSFRDVRIMRSGELAHRLDLYGYLLQGDNMADLRLEPGDVIFVPVPAAQVSIEGEVARPAIYEMLPDETVADLVAFSGGLNAPAYTRRASITRILAPGERTEPGVDRVTIDVDLAAALADPASAPPLRPGDAVTVYRVQPDVRNTVSIEGGVWHPGEFRLEPGMRAWDLIQRAEGLRDDAYRTRAQIVRIDPVDSTRSVVPFSLELDAGGLPVSNPTLQEFDAIRVFRESDYTTEFPVRIAGEVRAPLDTIFEEGLTLRDLILRAGGLTPTADLTVEVARLPGPARRGGDTIAEVIEVPVDSSYLVSRQGQRYYQGLRPPTTDAAAEFLLQPYDRVFVREVPDFETQRTIQVRGQVRQPGYYALRRKDERLSSVIQRAGGLRSEAYSGGARLFRDGVRVNVDLRAALASRGGRDDLILLAGDSLFIPEYNPVVIVQGAVNGQSPIAIQYRPGAGLGYYIDNAGGYARNADKGRVHVRFANGEGAAVGRVLFLFRTAPEPLPGSVVTVPLVPPEDRLDVTALISDLAQIGASLLTVALVLSRF